MRLLSTWSAKWMPVMLGSPVCSYYETVKVYRVTWVFSGGDTPGYEYDGTRKAPS
nr:MAG TPA: hypothetical protein [Caudoviricetes sp.]